METIERNQNNLSDQVYDYIKRMILAGEIKGGEKIPEERVGHFFGVRGRAIRVAWSGLKKYGVMEKKGRW